MSREEVRALAVGNIGDAFTEVKVQTVLQEFGEIINVSMNTFPNEIVKGTPVLQYALVYYSDADSYLKALAQASRIREKGFYVGGITQKEANFLNLKRSETGEPLILSLHRLLEYIYVSNKLLMFELCISYIDAFLGLVQDEHPRSFAVNPMEAVANTGSIGHLLLYVMPKVEFKQEFIMSEFVPTGIQVFQTQQHLFLIKVVNLAKLGEDHRIPETVQNFMLGCFKTVRLENTSDQAALLLSSAWRINFITEHLKSVEMSSRNSPEWYAEVLSSVQDAYFELSKTYYPYRHQHADLFATLDQVITSPNKKLEYPETVDLTTLGIPLRDIFPRPKEFIRNGFRDCTQAMLGLSFFRNHPRKLLRLFLKSCNLALSIKSTHSVDYASSWLEKLGDKSTICEPFPQIKELYVLMKSLIQTLKGDPKTAVCTLFELLQQNHQSTREPNAYTKTVGLVQKFGASISEPIMLRTNQFLIIENGLLAVTEDNRLLVKLFGVSTLTAAIESTTASLRYRDETQNLRYCFSKGTIASVEQGQYSWSYDLPCPDLGEESLSFDKLEVKLQGLVLIIEPSTPISAAGLSEQIKYKLEINRPQLLRQIKSSPYPTELVLAGQLNHVVVFMKVHSNEVESSLKLQFKDVLPGLVEDKVKIIYLTKNHTVEKSIGQQIQLEKSNEKHYALLIQYHPGLNPSERRELGVLVASTTFHCRTGEKHTRLEQRLVLQVPASIKASIDSIEKVNRLQLNNGLCYPAKFELDKSTTITLGPGETYSHLSIDKPLPSKLTYSFEDKHVEVLPSLSAWNPSLFQEALAGWNSSQIEMLVYNPQDSPLVKIKVEADSQLNLNSALQMQVTIEPSQNQNLVIGLNEFDMQDILVLGKGSFLVSAEAGKSVKLTFSLWPMRSGLLPLPEVTVCLFESPTRELGNDRVHRHPFWPYIKVVPTSETVCVQMDNLFNQRINMDGEVF